jgi:hypothetical protein
MTLTTRQIRFVVAFAALNVLLVVGGWVALVSPQRHDAASAAAQEQSVQSQIAALTTQSSQGSNTQPAIHTSDIYALDTALPSQVDQTNLLFELDQLATASDVDIVSISPQAAQANASNYTAVPINLSLDGTYFNLTGFLRRLRQLVSERQGHLIANGPLFAVTSLAYAPGESQEGNAKVEVATVGLSAFYYGAVDGATPPADTTSTDTTTTTGS